jgi:Putative beta-barrel porin 2
VRRMRTTSFGWAALVSMAVAVGTAPCSFAQGITPVGEYREGLPVGAWMLYPSIFFGAVYNDNFNQAPSNPSFLGNSRDTGWSARVSPRLVGMYDGGIYKTTVYGVADAQFFNANTVAASVGFNQSYAPLPDLTFSFFTNYTRQTDLFNSALMFNNNAIGPTGNPPNTIPLIINPFGNTPNVNPIAYNQVTGGGAVTKEWGQFFTTLGATAYYIFYDHNDNIPFPFQTSHDGGAFWLTGRIGYRFPSFYVFAEGSGIWQGFNNSIFNTDGYRVVGGVGTANPGSLWQAEVYGGYQAQFQRNSQTFPSGIPTGVPADTNSGVFGGRLSWYPTPYWTLIASVDETLGISTFPNSITPAGTPLLATTAILQTTYGLSRLWSIGVRGGYTRADYIGFNRLDNGWLVGASFNYEIWRNLALTLDYQYTTVHSDVAFADFTRNQYTAGLTYRY